MRGEDVPDQEYTYVAVPTDAVLGVLRALETAWEGQPHDSAVLSSIDFLRANLGMEEYHPDV